MSRLEAFQPAGLNPEPVNLR